MSLWQRITRSITRQKGKSILLLMILFVLGNAMAGTVAIREGTVNVQNRIKQIMGPVVLINHMSPVASVSGSGMKSEGINLDELIFEDIPIVIDGKTHTLTQLKDPAQLVDQAPKATVLDQIGDSPYVKYYDYSETVVVGSRNIKPIEGTIGVPEDLEHFGFTLSGTNVKTLSPIEYGGAHLVEGRTFTQEEIDQGKPVVILSSALAEKNDLAIGDTILFTNYPAFDWQEELIIGEIDVSLTLIGLVEYPLRDRPEFHGLSGSGVPEEARLQMQQNKQYVPNRLVQEINRQREQKLVDFGIPEGLHESWYQSNVIEPLFVLKDPDDIPAFIEENEALLPESYTFYSNHDTYDAISQPVRQTLQLSDSIMLFAAGAASLIVSLTVLLFIRDRKHEIGILMSLGESKGKIVGQIASEVMIIALLALLLSLLTGQMVAQRLSQSMVIDELSHELDYSRNDAFWQGWESMGPYASFIPGDDVAESYQITFSPSYIIRFILLGLFSALLATVLPILYAINLSPKKILMT